MDISKEITALNLPRNNFVVAGSGLLHTLKIRESNDIDLVVSKELFEIFIRQGWKINDREDGTKNVTNDKFDCMIDWYGKNVDQMLSEAVYINSIPYMQLEHIYLWKQHMGRKKDLIDLQLMGDYLQRNNLVNL